MLGYITGGIILGWAFYSIIIETTKEIKQYLKT